MAGPSLTSDRTSPVIDVVLVVVFLGLVAWFVWGSPTVGAPPAASAPVSARDLIVDPVRGDRPTEPITTIGSFERRCSECHRLFPSADETPRRLMQHGHVVLDHGLNDRCFNCHDRENRDRLALRGGRTVSFGEVPRLCAKCHGPTYRDWQRGMHGRSMFAWDPRSPALMRLQCSDCHDPHAPAYEPLRPLPGPNTLRMGDRSMRGHGSVLEPVDPLRKWRSGHRSGVSEHGVPDPEPGGSP